jgi:hypothetical protein
MRMISVTPYPDPLPHHPRPVRSNGWKTCAGWVVPSLVLASTWFGVCQLVQSLMP